MRSVDPDRLIPLLDRGIATPRVVAAGNYGTPWTLLGLVDRALEHYRLFMLNAQPGIPLRPGVIWESPFVGPGMRDAPGLEYVPLRLSLVPGLLAGTHPPDVVLVHVSRPRGGRVSLGTEVNILPAAIESARARGGLVVAQINPLMPYTLGDGEISLELIDLAIEAEEPIPAPAPPPLGDGARAMSEQVAALVSSGATLQLGIGAVPDAVLSALTQRRRLGIWSEMFSDGVLELERRGALDPDRRLVASFLFGSAELLGWVDANPRVHLRRTEVTNNPARIAAQPAMVSLNTALQIDLFDQANATRIGRRIISGFGGQPDFTSGALHSPGGRALIALSSWHVPSASSTVVGRIEQPVTSFGHSAVITEQGTAEIFGVPQAEAVRRLIAHAAHPDAREELRQRAEELGLAGTPASIV